MKKLITAAAFAFAGLLLSAQTISFTNTFGGDSDSSGGSDFLIFTKNPNDNTYTNDETAVSDRVQFDLSGEKIDARVRLEFSATKADGKNAAARIRGYTRFRPVSRFGIIAGNEFFGKFSIPGAKLAAANGIPSHGLIVKSGLAAYSEFGGEDFSIQIGAGADADSISDDIDKLGLRGGANLSFGSVLSTGFTVNDIYNSNRTFAAFASLGAVENLILNAGYTFNFYDLDFIHAATKHALQFTTGYNFTKIGLEILADHVTGITSDDTGIPFQTRAVVKFSPTANLKFVFDTKLSSYCENLDSMKLTLYPYTVCVLPSGLGTLNYGVRLKFNKEKTDSLYSFAFPVAWQWKISKKIN